MPLRKRMVSLKCFRKLSPRRPSTPLSGGRSWHRTSRLATFCPMAVADRTVVARSVFNAAACNNPLPPKPRVGRIVSELCHYVGGYYRQARSRVKDDRDKKRRLGISGFK